MIHDNPENDKLVIACIEDHPKAVFLLKTARYRAQEAKTLWGALFIENSDATFFDEARERLDRLQLLTKQMGGQVIVIKAASVENGLSAYLETQRDHYCSVIIGKAETNKKTGWTQPSLSTRLAKIAGRYTKVEILPLTNGYDKPIADRDAYSNQVHMNFFQLFLAFAAACAGALIIKHLPADLLSVSYNQNYTLIFLTACILSARFYGIFAGAICSLISALFLNYYFATPYHTLKLSAADLLSTGIFLVATLILSFFVSQVRTQMERVAKKEFRSQLLFTLYRSASGSFSRQQALEKLQHKLSKILELEVAFFLPPIDEPERIELNYPMDIMLDEQSQSALEMYWTEVRSLNVTRATNQSGEWYFEPMISPSGEIGILGIKSKTRVKLDDWTKQLFSAIADQTASILEHIQQERSMEAVRISDEKEKLRSMLLSSVSHDFKTPLAGIIGALSVHRSLGEKLSAQKRDELLEAAMEEAQRLDSFITNILDMTRLESGNIRFNFEWHSMHMTIRNVQKRLQQRLRQHELIVLPFDDADVYLDNIMTEQVLQNVLDNACKYTPSNTKIELYCHPDGEAFVCTIRDFGGGVPPGSIDLVFDKYTRLHKKDSQVAGTGLGLAISRAVMEAQGGSISVSNHLKGGAVFELRFPKWRKAETLKKNGTGI